MRFKGVIAKRLGRGLQILLDRFDSDSRLQSLNAINLRVGCFFYLYYSKMNIYRKGERTYGAYFTVDSLKRVAVITVW